MSNAIILNDSVPADCLIEVVLSNRKMLYHKLAKDLMVETAKFCLVKLVRM